MFLYFRKNEAAMRLLYIMIIVKAFDELHLLDRVKKNRIEQLLDWGCFASRKANTVHGRLFHIPLLFVRRVWRVTRL